MKPMIAHRLTNGEKEILIPRRFRQPAMNPILAKECLLKVKEILDARKLTFWLRGGTLLGAIRDGDFIPGDKDIDIGVYEDDAERVFPAILEFQQFGLKVLLTNNYDNSFQLRKIWPSGEMICFGFGSASRHRGYMWRWAGRFFEPRDSWSEFLDWPFLGTTFRVPKNYEEYLQSHYSDKGNKEAWKTPDPNKRPNLFCVRRRYR